MSPTVTRTVLRVRSCTARTTNTLQRRAGPRARAAIANPSMGTTNLVTMHGIVQSPVVPYQGRRPPLGAGTLVPGGTRLIAAA
jgi:hypothetical protein